MLKENGGRFFYCVSRKRTRQVGWRTPAQMCFLFIRRRSEVMCREGVVLVGAALFFALLGQLASAEILDFGPWEPNIRELGGATGSDAYAQSFIAPEENVLITAGMYLFGGEAEPPAVRVDIWDADAEGQPNSIVAEGPVYQEYFPRLTLVTIEPEDLVLTPGEHYFIVLNGMIDQESSGYYWSTMSFPEDPYPDGDRWWTNDMGGSWIFGGASDFGFYVETTAAGCAGDVDGDGDTDLTDLAALLAAYGTSSDDPGYDPNADFDDDGDVDLTDLAFLLADYGCGA